MSTLPPTAEQQAIIAFAKTQPTSSLVVQALAGTGKTTTICDHLVPVLQGTSLLLAYNKSIADELKHRVPAMAQLTCTISTVHGFGLAALRRSGTIQRNCKVDSGKMHFLLRNILDSKPSFSRHFTPRRLGASDLVRLVSHAKNAGFDVPTFPDSADEQNWLDLIDHFNMELAFEDAKLPLPVVVEIAQFLLKENNRSLGMIDFDDMVYFPLLLDATIQQYNNVIIDEAQDISATRLELASRAASTGRLIAVGDPNQAIYGFTGAMADSLDQIIGRHQATVLPLTICWRCDGEIIRQAQEQVPAIRCRPGAEALGQASYQSIEELLALDLPLGSAILCRLNRPNVALAIEMVRRHKPVKIEGRDFGKQLVEHVKRANPLYATTSLETLQDDLMEYGEKRAGELARKGKGKQAAFLMDELGCADLLLERTLETGATNFASFEGLIASLFGDNIPASGRIVLSSIHKAKGREWPVVVLLGYDDYMPFHMASMPWELEQEQNLIYVGKTRARQTLLYVTGVKDWLDSRASS